MPSVPYFIYFTFVFIGMLYAFKKVGINKKSVLIVLIFWHGLFQFLGTITGIDIDNLYKILLVLYLMTLTWNRILLFSTKSDRKVNIAFLLFAISFWFTFYLRRGGIVTILSQFAFKYGFVFLLYHYLKDILGNNHKREYVKFVILQVLYIQIILSIIKIVLFGFGYEPIVGSISAKGAGTAVVIPIISIIFFWLINDGKFTRKEWIIALLIFVISVASGKRQPIVFFPLVLFALFTYVKSNVKFISLIKYLPIIFLVFFLGVRFTPSVNPEQKVWGSFDLSYVKDYALRYYFGTSNTDIIFSDQYINQGRGGGFVYYFQPSRLTLNSIDELLFGKGRYEVATGAFGRFTATGRSDYGLEHSGLMGEAGAMLYSFGYVGTLFMVLLAVFIISKMENKKLALVLLLYYFWDFLFYYNQVIYSNQSALIVTFIVFYSNSIGYLRKTELLLSKSEIQSRTRKKIENSLFA